MENGKNRRLYKGNDGEEDKNDSNLSSDCRPRRKVFTEALTRLEDTFDDDDLNEKNLCLWRVCRELQIKLTHS